LQLKQDVEALVVAFLFFWYGFCLFFVCFDYDPGVAPDYWQWLRLWQR
jgi:hypothetical protein